MPDIHRTSPEMASALRVGVTIALLALVVMILLLVAACNRTPMATGSETDVSASSPATAASAAGAFDNSASR